MPDILPGISEAEMDVKLVNEEPVSEDILRGTLAPAVALVDL